MDFIYGLLTAVVFFVALMWFFWMGTKYEQQKKLPDTPKNDVLLKQKKLHEDFTKLMNYDVGKALERKKVT
jgi:hypothetical protein